VSFSPERSRLHDGLENKSSVKSVVSKVSNKPDHLASNLCVHDIYTFKCPLFGAALCTPTHRVHGITCLHLPIFSFSCSPGWSNVGFVLDHRRLSSSLMRLGRLIDTITTEFTAKSTWISHISETFAHLYYSTYSPTPSSPCIKLTPLCHTTPHQYPSLSRTNFSFMTRNPKEKKPWGMRRGHVADEILYSQHCSLQMLLKLLM